MFNMYSPTNGMMNGGMQSNCIPPNPISNVVGIGNNGYNNMMGGYYGGYNQGYYNPYMARQYQEIQQAKIAEQNRKQADIFKRISSASRKGLGEKVDVEEINKIYNPTPQEVQQYTEEQLELMEARRMAMFAASQRTNPTQVYNKERNMQYMISAKNKKEFPDSMDMFEYFENAWKILEEEEQEEIMRRRKDLSQLYNKNQYSDLIKMHSNSKNYFNSSFRPGGMNLDDLEATLPNRFKDELERKKKNFLNSIFSNMGV